MSFLAHTMAWRMIAFLNLTIGVNCLRSRDNHVQGYVGREHLRSEWAEDFVPITWIWTFGKVRELERLDEGVRWAKGIFFR